MKPLYTISLGVVMLIFLTWLFCGCNPVSKAIRTLDKNQPAAALYCATRFPAKDSLIKGDTITLKDTITNISVDTVSVDCPPNTKEVITIKAPCPAGKTIYVTKIIHDTIIRVDRAKQTVLENNLTACQTTLTKVQGDYEDMKDKRDRWRLWFWILLGAAGAYVVLKVKRIIPF